MYIFLCAYIFIGIYIKQYVCIGMCTYIYTCTPYCERTSPCVYTYTPHHGSGWPTRGGRHDLKAVNVQPAQKPNDMALYLIQAIRAKARGPTQTKKG